VKSAVLEDNITLLMTREIAALWPGTHVSICSVCLRPGLFRTSGKRGAEGAAPRTCGRWACMKETG
jgi:hypothetical protein